jgi:hypothetical protein
MFYLIYNMKSHYVLNENRGKRIEYEEQMANEEDIQYAKKQRRYMKLKKVHGKPHAK